MAFRNAKSLIDGLGSLLDHAPGDLNTREARLDAINRHYLDVSAEYPWIFLQTEVDWDVWAARNGPTAGSQGGPCTASVTNGLYLVGFTTTDIGGLGAAFAAAAEGQVFVDENGVEYLINQIDGTTAYLDRPYEGTTGSQTDWFITMNHVYLPVDCSMALGFIDRINGVGRMVIIDRRKEELWLSTQSTTTGTPYWVVDDDANYDRPPDPGWAIATTGAGGTLPASATYQYCYTFILQGRESPPSVELQITTGATNTAVNLITVSGIEDTRDGLLATGIKKKLYRRQITSSSTTNVYGRWLFLTDLDEGDVSFVDDGTPAPSLDNALALRFQNGRKWMRPKWVPGADETLRLRYLRYPRRLVADSDVPLWPEAFHDLLLYGAAIDLAMQYGLVNKVGQWEKQYEAMLKRMKSAHLTVPDAPTRKGRWGTGREIYPWRCGTATTDFTG